MVGFCKEKKCQEITLKMHDKSLLPNSTKIILPWHFQGQVR